MEVKPTKGLVVKVAATKEAFFGEEGVEIRKVAEGGNSLGVLTGRTLVGYCEVEVQSQGGDKHWYPIDQLAGENGDTLKEEEIPLPPDDATEEDGNGADED